MDISGHTLVRLSVEAFQAHEVIASLGRYLGEAHVCAHALAISIHIPDLDLAVQASRQQQMTCRARHRRCVNSSKEDDQSAGCTPTGAEFSIMR
jgi:hypothetical protein